MRVDSCNMQGNGLCPCPLEGINEVLIGKKWTISIIATIGNFNTIRFNDLSHRLKNISPKTLADRLKELRKHGIIKKEIYAEVPLRVEYSLTSKGKKLRDALIPMMEWAANN